MATLLEQYKGKRRGDRLPAEDWNSLLDTIETGIDNASGIGDLGLTAGDSALLKQISNNTEFSGKNETKNYTIKSPRDINLEPRWSNGDSNFNGPYGDVKMKPGDDVSIYSHHRAADKQGEVSVKILDANDNPVKLELNTDGIILQKKYTTTPVGFDEDAKSEFNVNVNTGGGPTETRRGYLKVRAKSIDLRCDGVGTHGGIALQPKGSDGKGYENKIKFEHGGGDGKEFGTFNTQKTSLYTDEYRFKKDGIVKMATRIEIDTPNNKIDVGDYTTKKRYQKNDEAHQMNGYEKADDFYDYIYEDDEQATWNSIIKTANALNDAKNRHTKITKSGNLEIQVSKMYYWEKLESVAGINSSQIQVLPSTMKCIDVNLKYNDGDFASMGQDLYIVDTQIYQIGGNYYVFKEVASPSVHVKSGLDINLIAEKDVQFDASDDVVLNAVGAVKLKAPEIRMNESNLINIGATKNIQFDSLKISKKGKLEAAGGTTISIIDGYNNMPKEAYYDSENGKLYIVLDKFYNVSGQEMNFAEWSAKAEAYKQDGSLVDASKVLFLSDGEKVWAADVNSSSQLKAYGNKDHTDLTTPDWENTIFVNQASEIPATATRIDPKPSAEASVTTVPVADIVTLVNWFKSNKQGPWAE